MSNVDRLDTCRLEEIAVEVITCSHGFGSSRARKRASVLSLPQCYSFGSRHLFISVLGPAAGAVAFHSLHVSSLRPGGRPKACAVLEERL